MKNDRWVYASDDDRGVASGFKISLYHLGAKESQVNFAKIFREFFGPYFNIKQKTSPQQLKEKNKMPTFGKGAGSDSE